MQCCLRAPSRRQPQLRILKNAKHHLRAEHAGNSKMHKGWLAQQQVGLKCTSRSSGIARGDLLAALAQPSGTRAGRACAFSLSAKTTWCTQGAQQRSLSGPHSSKQHARSSGIVKGTRLAAHVHPGHAGRACGCLCARCTRWQGKLTRWSWAVAV